MSTGFIPSNTLLVRQHSVLVIIVRGSLRTDCQHHVANRLRQRRQVINESHQLRRQNHSSAVFIPAETHRWQMLYRSLCRFLKAAKAVASGRAVVGGQRSFYAMAVVTADYLPTTYVLSRLPKVTT